MADAPERIHKVHSPLPPPPDGGEVLILRSMKMREEMSRPFEYTVELLSSETAIDPNQLLGKSMTIEVVDHGRHRYFNGLVSRMVNFGLTERYTQYRVELRPWFWFLGRTANCRIFQELSALEIFEKVAKETHGFSDYQRSVSGSVGQREYCVQYRESDFDFLSRLLEEEGIFYYFTHDKEKHTLVLGDSKTAYGKVDGADRGTEVPYRPPEEGQVETEHVSFWQVRHQFQSTSVVLDDFDFTKPKVDLTGESKIDREHTSYEVYDYPGLFLERRDGDTRAKVRIEELQSEHKRVIGDADHRGFHVGCMFDLIDYPRQEENAEYVLLSTEIEVESAEVEQFREDAENRFDVSFVAYPSPDPFRPARLTPKPFVKGPQTAIVVGKSSEEIWTDEYGRVKVQFHWDREGKSDEHSSCWIRVAQLWAGKSWGGIQIPRIGQEVVVDFLEGDPDRPLITGRVYNQDNMPPYDLPQNQSQSGVKSRSTKNGTNQTFNELRFEDKQGEEEIYLHAEKNYTKVVENNEVVKIGFEKMDPGDQTIEVYNHRAATIKQGNDSTTVDTGNHSTKIALGNHSINVDAGKSDVEAAQKITLKVGASKIEITPDSITLQAPQIKIKGDATLDATSPMTTVGGNGMTTVNGSLVKIN